MLALDCRVAPGPGVMRAHISPTPMQRRKQRRSKALESSEISDEIEERMSGSSPHFERQNFCSTAEAYNLKLTKEFCRNLLLDFDESQPLRTVAFYQSVSEIE